MVSKNEKKRMLEFIVGNLETSETIRPMNKEIVSGIRSNYIVVGKGGLILLMDQAYPESALDKLYRTANDFSRVNSDDQVPNVALIFYKDGEKYFRSAIESCDERQNNYYRRSLSHYTDDQKKKILILSPAELLIKDKRRFTQYYQPGSERLTESINSFRFTPARFERDIHPGHPAYGFAKPVEYSKRLNLIVDRFQSDGKFILKEGYLKGPCKKIE